MLGGVVEGGDGVVGDGQNHAVVSISAPLRPFRDDGAVHVGSCPFMDPLVPFVRPEGVGVAAA